MLNTTEVKQMAAVYQDTQTEEERVALVKEFAKVYNATEMEVRQALQEAKVYRAKEGLSEKQQYAKALWAITNISEKEWMKLTADSQKRLMAIFRSGQNV